MSWYSHETDRIGQQMKKRRILFKEMYTGTLFTFLDESDIMMLFLNPQDGKQYVGNLTTADIRMTDESDEDRIVEVAR